MIDGWNVQVFKTNLMFNWTVSLPAPEGNKFLFANENKLVHNCWPPSVAKLLGKGSMVMKTGDDHKYAPITPTYIFV